MIRLRLMPAVLVAAASIAAAAIQGGFFGGLVTTGDDQPLGSAQVIVEPLDGQPPVVAYANAQGLFRFPYVRSQQFLLRANAYGFQPRALSVDLGKDGTTVRLHVPAAVTTSAEGLEAAVKTVTVTSGARDSGWGADWSPTYSVCGEAGNGYRIRSHSFALRGERACGAWAECFPTQHRDSRVCWDFRLQGHSESTIFGQAVRRSEGVLTLVLEATIRPRLASLVTVYLICTRETETPARELRATLLADGWRVAELQTIEAPFHSRLVRPGRVETEANEEIARITDIVLAHRVESPGRFAIPSVEFQPAATAAPRDVLEVWLAPARPPRKNVS